VHGRYRFDATRPSHDFIVCRSADHDRYSVWRFDLGADELLSAVVGSPSTAPLLAPGEEPSFDRTHTVTAVGNYLLEWGPQQLTDYAPCFPYRLFAFDPTDRDPLNARAVLKGIWPKSKFWGSRIDFANPQGSANNYDAEHQLVLVPTGSYMLNLILTPGRGTCTLFNFDPMPPPAAPGRPASSDPLPFAQSPQGSLSGIVTGHELVAIGGWVLDWVPSTSEFALWSLDPQNNLPLTLPTQQAGRWETIDAQHQLVAIGDDLVLDWVPRTGEYRVWEFDPHDADVLRGPLRTGVLPESTHGEHSSLLAVQPNLPVESISVHEPGSIDFMRDKIKHVVYFMIENRSLDHVCGWLYEHDQSHVNFVGDDRPFDGANTKYFNDDPTGKRIHLSKYRNGEMGDDVKLELLDQDPYHDFADVMRQMFSDARGYELGHVPDMGGFVWNNGTPQVMETYTPEQLPVLNGLAEHFALSDEWFSSMPGGTDVNRAFSLTGSAMQTLNNFQNGDAYTYWPDAMHRPSIWKSLWANGIDDWKLYNSIEWMGFVFSYHLFLQGEIPKVDQDHANATPEHPGEFFGSMDQFLSDARSGNLPKFSYVEPVWIAPSGTTSYHPGGDLVPGEHRLNEMYDALRSGPHWDETLLVITFDEHGGVYDHVAPPYAVQPWPNDCENGFRYDLMGPRVPTILVSPWIRPNTVLRSGQSAPFDSTSILATLLEWFGVPRARWGLGERTRVAPTFETVLQERSPRTTSPAFVPPHDSSFDANGNPIVRQPLHDLHRLVAPRVVQSLTRGRLSNMQAQELADEIVEQATDVNALYHLLRGVAERY
jgi:phospholipase C